MATIITATVLQADEVVKIDAVLRRGSPLVDPVDYVRSSTLVQNQIKAAAGLPATATFVQVILTNQSYTGGTYEYQYLLTLDTLESGVGHSHDSSTLFHPLQEAYNDGPFIKLDPTLGPVEIFAETSGTVDYLRIHQDTTNIFYVRSDGTIGISAHTTYWSDTEYDIGSDDEGVTLRRPRDAYIGRNLWVATDAIFGGSAKSPHYLFFPQDINPDNDPLNRHIYFNSTDNYVHVWDGTNDYALGPGGTGGSIVGTYVGPTVNVGDAVTISAADTVIPANAGVSSQNPVIGICIDKPAPATAIVQLAGEIMITTWTLLPSLPYFLSKTSGQLTPTLAGFVSGDIYQKIGIAKDAQTITLQLGPQIQM